jgi:hypothetical protein
MTAICLSVPSAYLIYRGRFSPFHPLVFPVWSFLLPGFVIGGLLLSFGYADPFFLSFVRDEQTAFPLAFTYCSIGYLALAAGFAIPQIGSFGRWIGNKLPAWDIRPNVVVFPATVLLALGVFGNIASFFEGVFGFQRSEDIPIYGGLLTLTHVFWTEGTVLLWLSIFRSKLTITHYIAVVLIVTTTLVRAAFVGSRISLIQAIILGAFAFAFVRGRLRTKHYAVGVIVLTVGLIVGTFYGTSFRTTKGTANRVETTEYIGAVSATISKMSDLGPETVLQEAASAIAERLDSVSSLAVIVSNYEVLAADEERWGINGNIYTESVTFFVPRVIWPEKPVAIPLSKYGDLYFNYSENSFAMTPMGDLLRNFGPIGVPLGMLFLGVMIRLFYSALVEDRSFSYWRGTLFLILLTSISYEATYGEIIPILFKTGFTAVVGLFILSAMERLARRFAM